MGTFINEGANSKKRSKSQPRANLKKKILRFWNTRKTLFQIAAIVGCRQPTVKSIFIDEYGITAMEERKHKLYRYSKLNTKNPMKGKNFEKHPNWKGSSLDHKGYLTVVKPDWWTGRGHGKRIFEHHYIYALHHGLTFIPKGMHVHHKDGNGLNNDITNLQLVTPVMHARLHRLLKKRVTTIS